MEIFVSDKEIKAKDLNHVEEDWKEEYFMVRGIKEKNGFDMHDDVGLVEIKSLEAHDAEVKQAARKELLAELEVWVHKNKQEMKTKTIIDYCWLRDKINKLGG